MFFYEYVFRRNSMMYFPLIYDIGIFVIYAELKFYMICHKYY